MYFQVHFHKSAPEYLLLHSLAITISSLSRKLNKLSIATQCHRINRAKVTIMSVAVCVYLYMPYAVYILSKLFSNELVPAVVAIMPRLTRVQKQTHASWYTNNSCLQMVTRVGQSTYAQYKYIQYINICMYICSTVNRV